MAAGFSAAGFGKHLVLPVIFIASAILLPPPWARELRGCWVFGGRFWQTFGLACYLYRFSHLTPSPVGEGWGGYNLITSFTS